MILIWVDRLESDKVAVNSMFIYTAKTYKVIDVSVQILIF